MVVLGVLLVGSVLDFVMFEVVCGFCVSNRTAPYSDESDNEFSIWADLEGPCWQRAHWRVLGVVPIDEVCALPHAGIGTMRWFWFRPAAATLEACRAPSRAALLRWANSGCLNEDINLSNTIVCSLPALVARMVASGCLLWISMSLGRRCEVAGMSQLSPLRDIRASIQMPDPSDGG